MKCSFPGSPPLAQCTCGLILCMVEAVMTPVFQGKLVLLGLCTSPFPSYLKLSSISSFLFLPVLLWDVATLSPA